MYVFYVLSDDAYDWMTYYTLHKYKGAHQYVRLYALPDGYVEWMLYYALHKYEVCK